MRLFKSGRNDKRADDHEIARRPTADTKASSPTCGRHCVLRQLYDSSTKASLPSGKLQGNLEEDNRFYLQPGLDLYSLTIPQLRTILATHNVSYPSPSAAKQGQLVELVQRYVISKTEKVRSERDRASSTRRGTTDTISLTPERLPSRFDELRLAFPRPSTWVESRQVYEPLRPWQTRLIELLPSQTGKGIPTCRLLTVEFIDMEGVGITDTNEVVTYNAISYVWGRTTMDSHVICNGIEMPVPTNLAVALRYLAKSEHKKYYWCDGICIDQGNDLERAQQIRVMLRIFEKAEAVVAWMGELDAHHLPSLAFIKRDMNQTDSAFELAKGQIHHLDCVVAVQTLQLVLHQLTCRPWFRRTWIRQEIFAAKKILLHFEDFKMAFDFQHERLWQWLRCDPTMLQNAPRAMEKSSPAKVSDEFVTMATQFRHYGTDNKNYTPPPAKISHSLHWLRTLQEGTAFEVTDPRDRVYAVLGMVASPSTRFWVAPPKYGTGMTNGTTPKDFPVDYEKSTSKVYQDVVKYLINVERNLDSLCTFQDRRRRNSDMPSWALDWRDDSARNLLDSSHDLAEVEQSLGQPPLQDLNESLVLHVSGFEAGKIFSLHGGSPDWTPSSKASFWWTFGQEALTSGDDIPHCREYYVAFNRDVQLNDSQKLPRWIDFLVPRDSMLDDEIVFAKGARTPLVLRRIGNGKHRFIGPVMMIMTGDLAKNTPEFLVCSVLRVSPGIKTAYPYWSGNAKLIKDYVLV